MVTMRNKTVKALNDALVQLFIARATDARVKRLMTRWIRFLESDTYIFMPDSLLSQVYGAFAREYMTLCRALGVTPTGVDPSVAMLITGDIDVAMRRAEKATVATLKAAEEVTKRAGKAVAWTIGPTAILIALAALAIGFARR